MVLYNALGSSLLTTLLSLSIICASVNVLIRRSAGVAAFLGLEVPSSAAAAAAVPESAGGSGSAAGAEGGGGGGRAAFSCLGCSTRQEFEQVISK